MPTAQRSRPVVEEKFSLPLFAFTVIATLAGLVLVLKLAAPHLVWGQQFSAVWWKAALVVVAVTALDAFVEYFFHRYVLHKPVIPFLSRFYRQHTKHHGLTRIGRKRTPDGKDIPFIENIYPVVTPEQGEASFFPWYTLAVFALVLTPLFALCQWLAPSFPWFLYGYGSLALSLVVYEGLHALEHFPLEKWMPLMENRRWGWLWTKAYSFHLRHHAVIDCNESISGFFTLPLTDLLFGTFVIPPNLYADGAEWDPAKFQSPRPRAFIRWCDRFADAVVKNRREQARADAKQLAAVPADHRTTLGEKILNGLTHGLGLALSVAGLVLLVTFACLRGNVWHVVSFSAFGVTLVLLYVTSTLHHGIRAARWKRLFMKFNHAAIFLLLAGTYTPFLLLSLRGPWGWSLFGVVWGLCIAGVVFQLFFAGRFRAVTTFSYLLVGWLAVIAIKPLVATVPHGALWLMLAGGVSYTVATIFLRMKSLPYHHAVWRGFVLSGSACHLVAVLVFMLPGRM